jgi:hypothetical protein
VHDDEMAAVGRLHDAMSREAHVIGPHELDDNRDPIVDKPLGRAILDEWVLVMSWTNTDTGRRIITRATSPDLPRHHENGLLHEALYEFD